MRILVTTIAVFAALFLARDAAAGGYAPGQVVNGFTYNAGGYWVKGGYSYHPKTYYGRIYYSVKPVGGYDVKSRLLDLAQQKQTAREALDLAAALGLSPSEVSSTFSGYAAANSYNGVSPLYNAAVSGQSVLYGSSQQLQSAASYIVQSEASFDFNAEAERKRGFLTELAKVLGASDANMDSIVQQLAQIAAIQTQGAVTIAEAQETTEQINAIGATLEKLKPKDKATVQYHHGASAGVAGAAVGDNPPPLPQPPNGNQIFSARDGRGLTASCNDCHTERGEGSNEKALAKLNLNHVITADQFLAAMEAMDTQTMPPAEWQAKNGAWEEIDTAQVRRELRALMNAEQ